MWPPKSHLRGKVFDTDDDVIDSVEMFLGDQNYDKEYDFYKEGIKKLEYRWNKCIEVGGENVKK